MNNEYLSNQELSRLTGGSENTRGQQPQAGETQEFHDEGKTVPTAG